MHGFLNNQPDIETISTDVVVIGSGAGGSVTAYELAKQGREIIILEEGKRFDASQYGLPPTSAMLNLYRRGGMTPIWGSIPIGYAEGCTVGGSTEINSGFWRRTNEEVLNEWKIKYNLLKSTYKDLEPHFKWAEELLHVGLFKGSWPLNTEFLATGIKAQDGIVEEIPRAMVGCKNSNLCPSGCPNGAKQSMSKTLLPAAEKFGAKILSSSRAKLLIKDGSKINNVLVQKTDGPKDKEFIVKANSVFVCCGATETPALLIRSGIKKNIGKTILVHPMLKIVAFFKEEVKSGNSVIPFLQMSDPIQRTIFGGAYWSKGHVAMILSEYGKMKKALPDLLNKTAIYYLAVKGRGKGSVTPSKLNSKDTIIKYELSRQEILDLYIGTKKLCNILLSAGAEELFPAIGGISSITSKKQLDFIDRELVSKRNLNLTTVHAFSSCPAGEKCDYSAINSFGKVHGFENLFINDASMLPDSPAANPQAIIMAMARRNVLNFLG